MSEALAASGAFGYIVLALGAIGILVNLGLAGLAFTKKRIPLTAIVAAPMLALAMGGLGTWLYAGSVWSAIESATGSEVTNLAFDGSYQAMWTEWLARWSAAVALAVGAWAAAVGSLVPGEEGRMTPGAAAGVLFTTLVGAAIGSWWAIAHGVGGLALVALFVFAGLGVALSATRRATDEQMFRVAGMRFTAGLSAVLAVWNGFRAVDVGNQIRQFSAGEIGSTIDLHKALALYESTIAPVFMLGLIILFFALIVASIGSFAELGEVIERYTMYDLLGVAALMALAAVFRISASNSVGHLFDVGTNEPALHVYRGMTNGLGPSVLVEGETGTVVPVAKGGYGDVFALESVGGGKYDWFRIYTWNGHQWNKDHTALADATLSPVPPLIAIQGTEQAKVMLPILEKSGGKGYVLTRASEGKPGVIVPPEVNRHAVAFLPVEMSSTRDLQSELWMEAGSLEVMHGPTVWFGEGDDLEPVAYMQKIATTTQAKGLNVSFGERRVNDIIQSCLPFVMDKVEAEWKASDRWCHITTDDMTKLRAEAAAAWPVPAPENVTMTTVITGPLDPAEVNDRLSRELGALSYCVDKAVKANEPVAGDMLVLLAISKDGAVFDTRLDEKSKVQSPTMLGCTAKRFKGMGFTLPPEAPPVPVVEGQEPPPPPPIPGVAVTLTIVAPEPVPPTPTATNP